LYSCTSWCFSREGAGKRPARREPDAKHPGTRHPFAEPRPDPLLVRSSANAASNQPGANCLSETVIGDSAPIPNGRNSEVGFLAAPQAEITLRIIAASKKDGFQSGADKLQVDLEGAIHIPVREYFSGLWPLFVAVDSFLLGWLIMTFWRMRRKTRKRRA